MMAPVPRISFFYGIVITMYSNDHAPPHFHARYGKFEAKIAIDDGEVRIFNQNDARPVEDGPVAAFGPFDAHF